MAQFDCCKQMKRNILVWLLAISFCNLTSSGNGSLDDTFFSSVLNQMMSNNMTLKKTHFSSNRLLFVAGLEGTGHHALEAMFRVCSAPRRGKKCEVNKKISNTLFDNQNAHTSNTRSGLFFPEDAIHAGYYATKVIDSMYDLVEDGGEHLYFLGLGLSHGSGMLSYPNYNMEVKTLSHPDAFLLAAFAEKVGLDFRVLVLQREGINIMNSTLKRGFGASTGAGTEGRILADNAAALYSQLRLLDPRFFHCLNYSSLPDLSKNEKAELVEFLHPTVMKSFIDEMLLTFHRPTDSSTPSSNHRHLREEHRREGPRSRPPPFIKKKEVLEDDEANNYWNVFNLEARIRLIDGLCEKKGKFL